MSDQLIIFDTTLRDGEQSPGASMTKDEKRHLSAVAELGCAVCRRMGYEGTPAEIHHKRAGTGAGRR